MDRLVCEAMKSVTYEKTDKASALNIGPVDYR